MRPFTIGDVLCAARYLLLFEPGSRHAAARSLVQRATAADRWRAQRGRAHRCWGNGTLMAAAGLAPLPPTPPLGDPGFLDALCVMLGSQGGGGVGMHLHPPLEVGEEADIFSADAVRATVRATTNGSVALTLRPCIGFAVAASLACRFGLARESGDPSAAPRVHQSLQRCVREQLLLDAEGGPAPEAGVLGVLVQLMRARWGWGDGDNGFPPERWAELRALEACARVVAAGGPGLAM